MEASALHAPSFAHRQGSRSRVLRLRSDEQLLALFRRGSDEAFGVIFDRYRARLTAYTRRMLGGSQQDAEDALQDVFLRAYSSLRADERPVSVRAWLYRVAHNRCIDQIRRATPLPEDLLAASRPTATHDPVAAFQRREDLRQIVADVAELPDTQRSALLLREMEGLSYAELCDTLDLSIGAVKSVLVRARTSLAETGEARATPCAEIRVDITTAHDAGTRVDSRARRHLRECAPCTDYRAALRAEPRHAAAGHSGPLGFIAKLLGLSSAPVAGGGGAVVAGGISSKVAVIVCCGLAAAGAGAAAELPHSTSVHAAAPSSASVYRHAGSHASAPATQAVPVAATSASASVAQEPSATSAPSQRSASADRRSQALVAPAASQTGTDGATGPLVSTNAGVPRTSGGATAPSDPSVVKPATPDTTAVTPAANGRDGTGAATGTDAHPTSPATPGASTPGATSNGRGSTGSTPGAGSATGGTSGAANGAGASSSGTSGGTLPGTGPSTGTGDATTSAATSALPDTGRSATS